MFSTESTGRSQPNRLRVFIWSGAALLWLLPCVAMHFTHEVAWSGSDFVVFGAMLLFVCGVYELGARVSPSTFHRAGLGVALVTGFFLLWINLAVGIIGDENNPANLMFLGVLVFAVAGGVIARLRSRGMARAMLITSFAQLGVAVIAFVSGAHEASAMTAACAVPWGLSAWLFNTAASRR